MREARRVDPEWDLTRSWDLPSIPALPGEDLESYLRRIGFSDVALSYTQRGFAGALSEAMRHIDAQASLDEMHDTSAGKGDYRILDGYTRLHDLWARGLDIRLETIVETVDWNGDTVRVTTADGTEFQADRVLVTLPLAVLKAGRVRFVPELPAQKQAAIEQLRVGPVLKMVYRFAEPILPDGVMALYSALNPCMWWSPSFAQATDQFVITAFVTADRARELLVMAEAEGEDAALAQGVAVLRKELNRADLQPVDQIMVNWVADPYALGGYSVTTPGAIDAHTTLAEPVANRLFWAGEATAGHLWKATVHGAYASGCRAAAEILNSR